MQFNTTFVMPGLGELNVSAFNVSHSFVEGVQLPDSPVSIVGRVNPKDVWRYIGEIKTSKEVFVFRLEPQLSADKGSYEIFYNYFTSRGRYGVIGGVISPTKYVYLVPLAADMPLDKCLSPFYGAGIPCQHPTCLLAVVVCSAQKVIYKTKWHGDEIRPNLSTRGLVVEEDVPYDPALCKRNRVIPYSKPFNNVKPMSGAEDKEIKSLAERIKRKKREIDSITQVLSKKLKLDVETPGVYTTQQIVGCTSKLLRCRCEQNSKP